MILAGLSAVIVIEIYAAIMQWQFQDTSNTVGKGFAILGIYLFCCFCKFSIGQTICNQRLMTSNRLWPLEQYNLAVRSGGRTISKLRSIEMYFNPANEVVLVTALAYGELISKNCGRRVDQRLMLFSSRWVWRLPVTSSSMLR